MLAAARESRYSFKAQSCKLRGSSHSTLSEPYAVALQTLLAA